MPTNPNVLINRDKYIGGSDISAIMGISPFKTRWEVLQEKAGLLESEFTGNKYTEYGDEMEAKIRAYINKDYAKDPFIEDTVIQEREIIGLRCNYDGKNKKTGLEIKTTSQVHEDVREYKHYIVQLLFGMKLDSLKKGKLAVYERPEDFSTEFDEERLQQFDIELKDFTDWSEEIDSAIDRFTYDLQRLLENPFLSEEDLMPKDLMAVAKKVEDIEKKLVEYKQLEKENKEFKADLKKAMEKYGIKTWVTNNDTRITLTPDKADEEVEVTVYDEELFIAENTELHEAYHNKLAEYKTTKTEIKKGKAGYLTITLPKEKNEN